jgi:endonuclease YncB( thermonuclease family)
VPATWPRPLAPLLLGCAIALAAVPTAGAQAPATVTDVLAGDAVAVRLGDGSELGVRLIGVDAPAPRDCGGDTAAELLERLFLDRAVTLVADPFQTGLDAAGRSLFYVDRDDGLDAGRELLRAGLAEVSEGRFARLDAYDEAAAEAEADGIGVWRRCDGDFHLSPADVRRELQRTAVQFMRGYYRAISRARFAHAWGMLGRPVRRKVGPFRRWRAGHRRTLSVSVSGARARLSGRRAVVTLRLRARDRDACTGRVVRQRFSGRWVLSPRRGSWVAVRVRMRKTGGGRVRLSRSECRPSRPAPAPAPAPTPAPPPDCQGYSPCLPPGPDVDCAGGSGDGPRYVDGPVSVTGSDPYDLDRDGDGVGCDP